MLNPQPLVDAVVTALQSIELLVAAMNGSQTNIYAHHYVFGEDQSLARAIQQMTAPSILVAWMGAKGGNFDGATLIKDSIAIYIRMANQAGEVAPVAYEELWWLIVNSPVNGTTLNIRYLHLVPGKWEIPDNPSVEHDMDLEGMDRFCAHFAFPQIGDQ
ncbi:MAG TPA: hypothetical protein VNU19_01575 [Candidatus Acidoferrum sp.]|jgi:hypothetical protein|nr:hypothetical protein [Candidatus Acidoferrum sp.]